LSIKATEELHIHDLSELLENDSSEYSQQLLAGFGNLQFAKALETEFQHTFAQKRLVRLRMAIPIGALVTLLIQFSDFFRLESALASDFFVLRSIALAGLIPLGYLVYKKQNMRLELLTAVALCIYGIGSSLILGLKSNAGFDAPVYTYIMILIFCYFMGGMSFRATLITAFLITFTYPLGQYLMGFSYYEYDQNLFFLFIFHALGIPGAWYIEYSAREQYLNRHLLSKMAMYDSLTNLPNRRSFFIDIARLCRQANRDGTSLAVAMLDVDHFKSYNDNFGHIAGDQCLQKLASMITDSIKRPFDNAGRYGGEEFSLAWYDCDEHQARQLAEKLREDIQTMAIQQAPEIDTGVITVSIGVCVRPPSSDIDEDRAISIADKALYEAKSAGRNQVIVHTA
jgi:diguanylate cyclase (GGDEF)-like protein